VSNTFSEQKYAVVRQSSFALIVPCIFLAGFSALFFFFIPKISEVTYQQLITVAYALALLIFWLLPSIRFLTNRSELSSTRVISRTGLFGTKVDEVSWGELTGVSITRGFRGGLTGSGDIHLHREFGVDFVLRRVPRPKRLSREIESFLASRLGMRK
jgi:hypothetical protein